MPEPESTSYYPLRPKVPVRALVLAAVLVVVGVFLLILQLPMTSVNWQFIVALALLVLGLALVVASLAFVTSGTQHVVLSSSGFEVTAPNYHRSAPWAEVTSVRATPDNTRLVIAVGQVTRIYIQSPGGKTRRMAQLINDIQRRLVTYQENNQ